MHASGGPAAERLRLPWWIPPGIEHALGVPRLALGTVADLRRTYWQERARRPAERWVVVRERLDRLAQHGPPGAEPLEARAARAEAARYGVTPDLLWCLEGAVSRLFRPDTDLGADLERETLAAGSSDHLPVATPLETMPGPERDVPVPPWSALALAEATGPAGARALLHVALQIAAGGTRAFRSGARGVALGLLERAGHQPLALDEGAGTATAALALRSPEREVRLAALRALGAERARRPGAGPGR